MPIPVVEKASAENSFSGVLKNQQLCVDIIL